MEEHMVLGKLQKVELRNIWQHEANDFTTWLARKENMDVLCEEIGLDIQIINTEATVGSFAVDILAEETNTGKKVIIENQLESTNHDHLGKIITYASGLEANYIIWIFKNIRDEHRRAIDWLNEVTNGEVNFFAIQMELWQIGDSPPAPKFNIISSPNDWAKAVRQSQSLDSLSDSNIFQLDFWKGLSEYLVQNKSILKPRKPRGQHWYDFSIGNSQAHLSFVVSVSYNFIRIDFYIPDNKLLFQELLKHKDIIEKELNFSLDWQELPNAKASRIAYQLDIKDIKNQKEILNAYKWSMDNGEKILKALDKYL
jgi:hypothetical protein